MNKNYVTKKCIGLFAALIIFISAACFASYADGIETDIRVGLNYSTTALELVTLESSENYFTINIEGYTTPITLETSHLFVSVYDDVLYVKNMYGTVVSFSGAGIKTIITPKTSTAGLVINGNHYYGGFEFYADSNGKIVVINILDIEDYIKGVLPSEVYPSWHIEALKAAAVVSRTFALRNAASSSHSADRFDICNTIHCQMYEGTKKENVNTNAAISATSGIVVMYNGTLATTPYHSSTGGYTASAAEVWGGKREAYPYLTNVFNPYEDFRNVPNGKWESIVKPDELMTYISSSYVEKLPAGNLSFVYDKSKNGFISSMTVSDTAGNTVTLNTADKVRGFFGKLVKSANFGIAKTYVQSDSMTAGITVITSTGQKELTGLSGYDYITSDGIMQTAGITEVLVFDGKGYGHGVGLSQFGSRDMANAGFAYDQILSTYFPGTQLVSIYN